MMDKQQFLDKLEELESPDNDKLRNFLNRLLHEGLSKKEIAKAGKTSISTISRRLTDTCEHFDINVERGGVHEDDLINLFRQFKPDFLHPSILEAKVNSEILNRPQLPNIPPPDRNQELTTLEFIGRDRDLTNLANLSRQAKIVLIKDSSGGGKSTLAKKFLKAHFQEPNIIEIDFALPVEDNVSASDRLPIILKQLSQEISTSFALNLDCLKRRLSDRQQPPVAFLIDNLESALDSHCRFLAKLNNYEALLGVLGDSNVLSFTLITSRRSLITERGTIRHLSLKGLDITAWQQYFHDCDNEKTSEALIQMHDAYNGNPKIMHILHDYIKEYSDGNIGIYWNRYKDKLLANKEIETLISAEINWLRDNQPDAYKLFYQIGSPVSQNNQLMSFDELLKLLQDIPESRRSSAMDFLVVRTSLLEKEDMDSYYLSPVLHEAARLHWVENISVFGKPDLALENELNMYNADRPVGINSQAQIDMQGLHNDVNLFSHTPINKESAQEMCSIKSSDLMNVSTQPPSIFTSLFPMSGDSKIGCNNIEIQQIWALGTPTNTMPLDHNSISLNTMNSQLPSMKNIFNLD